MARTLLDITDDMQALDALLAEVCGDVTDAKVAHAIDEWFRELDRDLTAKADGYAAFITELKARAETRAAEAKRLAARARSDEETAAFLSVRLRDALEARGIKKLETARYTVSVVGNGGKAPLDLHGQVPPEWSRTIVEPDRERIREALEAGQSLPFANLMERGRRLSIR